MFALHVANITISGGIALAGNKMKAPRLLRNGALSGFNYAVKKLKRFFVHFEDLFDYGLARVARRADVVESSLSQRRKTAFGYAQFAEVLRDAYFDGQRFHCVYGSLCGLVVIHGGGVDAIASAIVRYLALAASLLYSITNGSSSALATPCGMS